MSEFESKEPLEPEFTPPSDEEFASFLEAAVNHFEYKRHNIAIEDQLVDEMVAFMRSDADDLTTLEAKELINRGVFQAILDSATRLKVQIDQFHDGILLDEDWAKINHEKKHQYALLAVQFSLDDNNFALQLANHVMPGAQIDPNSDEMLVYFEGATNEHKEKIEQIKKDRQNSKLGAYALGLDPRLLKDSNFAEDFAFADELMKIVVMYTPYGERERESRIRETLAGQNHRFTSEKIEGFIKFINEGLYPTDKE